MKNLVDVRNPSEQQLLLASCEYAGARKALLEAVNAKFGEPAMTRLGGRMLQINLFDVFLNDLETNTDKRTEKIHGNEAILTITEGEFSDVRMVRDDNARRNLFELDGAIQSLGQRVGQGDPAIVQLTGVYHNLLRRWADS